MNAHDIIDLPDEIIHTIFSYVADSPSLIGPCVCHMLRLLSKHVQQKVDTKRDFWELAIHDLLRDYYVSNDKEEAQHSPLIRATNITDPPHMPPRRVLQRGRPATPKERYIHSYNLLLSRNESALLELTEHTHSSKKRLSISVLKKLLREYEPVAINRRVRTGGTFLVEIARARHVQESIILQCTKLLIGRHGANPNVPSAETVTGRSSSLAAVYETRSPASGEVGSCSSSSTGAELYPLIIAAARGMPTVVKYLLSVGANPYLRGSSRFRLHSNPRKSVKGVRLTALDFATKMREHEVENGARKDDLRGLVKVIALLQK